MPVYNYRCPKCGVFETEQRITAPPLETCPTCREPVYRIISNNIAIIYNGSGFYTTDNRGRDYKSGITEDGKKEDGKSESKAS